MFYLPRNRMICTKIFIHCIHFKQKHCLLFKTVQHLFCFYVIRYFFAIVNLLHNLKSKLSIQPSNKILTWKEQGSFCVLRLLEQKQKTPFPAMIKQKDNFKGRTTTMHFFLIRTVLLAQMAFFHNIQKKIAITIFHVGEIIINSWIVWNGFERPQLEFPTKTCHWLTHT